MTWVTIKGKKFRVGKSNLPDSSFNKLQLKKGINVELEHTDSRKIAKQIAKDHLVESPKYYIELGKLERRLKNGKK